MKMSKGLKLTLAVLLSIIAVVLTAGLVIIIKSDFKFNFDEISISSNLSTNLIEEKEIDNIKDLDINTSVADIYVEESDRNTIKVELYSNYAEKYEITEEDDSIKVVLEDKKITGFNFFRKLANVKIYVPKEYSNLIKIDSKAADIKIGNISNANLQIKSDVGDIKVKEINNVEITDRVGDIKIEKVNTLVTEVKTGDTKIGTVNNIKAKTTTGDIKIETVNNSLNLTSKTGDIKIQTANIKEDSKIVSNVGDVKIKKTTGCYIEGKTNVGDTDINNNDRKSDITLKITSSVGDIRVN